MRTTFVVISLAFLAFFSGGSVAFADDGTETMEPLPPGLIQTAPDPSQAQPADAQQQPAMPLPPIVPLPPDPTRKPLDDYLAKIKGAETGQMSVVSSDALKEEFPGVRFYALHFRMFPAAHATPDPLKPANIFALSPEGTVTLISDEDSLKSFFRYNAPSTLRNDQAREVLKAWLKLVLEFKQDGFYEFSLPGPVNVTSRTATTDLTATAKVTATRGGRGDFSATVSFGDDGKLQDYKATDNIKPGIRPVCQATKLLDKDPIVRKIAEKDILVMGQAAQGYLIEQRARATPDLQREIDRVWNQIIREGW